MIDKLIIRDILASEDEKGWKVCADVGGDNVWFRTPFSGTAKACAEPFIAVALLEAMYTGQDIQVDSKFPVSRRFVESLADLQGVFHLWNRELKLINLEATIHTQWNESGRVGSFFSAGIDSSHTLCRHMDEITHLVLMDAFDDPGSEEEWQTYVRQQSVFAKKIGKQLIPVTTNVRQYAYEKRISWEFMHGCVLSTVGNLFGFDKVYVPSSYTYLDLFPWGSHPITDPMWSTESMRVIHDGAGQRRWEKVRTVMTNQQILDNIHVCWRQKVGNCGECPKCVRTMIALYLLNRRAKSIPDFNGLLHLKRLKAMDSHDAVFLEDAALAAKTVGDKSVHRKLARYLRQYRILLFIENMDKALLGGFMRKIYRRLRKPKWLNYRVTLGPKN